MKKVFLILMIFLIIPAAFAKQGHIPLLAVRETSAGLEGSLADLYLEVTSGSGRIFIETVPLTKFDTQISTRFANQVACDYLDADCSKYDFFYTIRADSSIVGGPSAGAATTILTIAMIEGFDLDESIAMTGTINSGGLIGPVAGIKEKIDAASNISQKVLVPTEVTTIKEFGLTLDLKKYAREKYNIEVIEVADLTDALYQFTGKRYKDTEKELVIDENYKETMKILAEGLCDRNTMMKNELSAYNLAEKKLTDIDFLEVSKIANELSKDGKKEFENQNYYSAASFCFGSNLRYHYLISKIKGVPDFENINNSIKNTRNLLAKEKIRTITDLEAFMIVKERLKEASENLDKAMENYRKGKDYHQEQAYAAERVVSAVTWMEFFSFPGKEFHFDRQSLEKSCQNKLSEAIERFQYASLFLEKGLEDTEKELEYAKGDQEQGLFELCLFRASKAKAESDIVLGALGVSNSQISHVLENKLRIVKQNIIEEQEKGTFPVLGYSYYEYANVLKEESPYSAWLFAEYALELSNLDMYFKEVSPEFSFEIPEKTGIKTIAILAVGIIIGILIALSIRKKKRKTRTTKKRKRKR
ncbi:hypothetical protein KY317_02740 [Candidatus Woesearchaeota archaeon]|nr:hypothetical protein [Candidatus Woesearchaeota archaeon]